MRKKSTACFAISAQSHCLQSDANALSEAAALTIPPIKTVLLDQRVVVGVTTFMLVKHSPWPTSPEERPKHWLVNRDQHGAPKTWSLQ